MSEQMVWWYIPNTNTRVVGKVIGISKKDNRYAVIERVEDGKRVAVYRAALRAL